MTSGNIVMLNGTSSAGKTSTARALQQIKEALQHPARMQAFRRLRSAPVG